MFLLGNNQSKPSRFRRMMFLSWNLSKIRGHIRPKMLRDVLGPLAHRVHTPHESRQKHTQPMDLGVCFKNMAAPPESLSLVSSTGPRHRAVSLLGDTQ